MHSLSMPSRFLTRQRSDTRLARSRAILQLAQRRRTQKTLPGQWIIAASRLVTVMFALAVALTLVAPAQAQNAGVLTGRVENSTADGQDVGAGIPVTLRVFRGDTQADSLETTTDGDGSFRFEGLDTATDLEYWPEATYLGIVYAHAAPLQFDDERTSLEATIPVYETTNDDSFVSLDSVHFIAESFGEVLRVSEIHLLRNSGDRTYVGRAGEDGQLVTVFVPLPQNAVGLAFEQGATEGRFVTVDGGFVDTEPLPPGQESSLLFFSYHLMVGGDRVPLERRFAYPVSNLSVLVAQPGLTLQSDQLESRGPEFLQGRQYEFLGAQNLTADAPLNMEFVPMEGVTGDEGLAAAAGPGGMNPASGAPRGNQALLRWLGFGLVALAAAGAVVYPLARGQQAPDTASSPDLLADPQARRLLAELTDLEEAFEAGQADEAEYEQQRAELRGELKSL